MTKKTKDVTAALTRLKKTWAAAGITRQTGDVALTADHLIVEMGSPTYGRAYRLFYRHPVTGGRYDAGIAYGYLGLTAREAVQTLDAMQAGVELGMYQRGPVIVTTFTGEDGTPVVQLDTDGTSNRVRVNVNDATVYDRDVETGEDFGDDLL